MLLFTSDDLEGHTSSTAKEFNKVRGPKRGQGVCTSHFIQKMDWVPESEEVSGKLHCPYCSAKLGEFNWAGKQCSCGKYVTPAFQIHRGAVDDGTQPQNTYIAKPRKWKEPS